MQKSDIDGGDGGHDDNCNNDGSKIGDQGSHNENVSGGYVVVATVELVAIQPAHDHLLYTTTS